MSEKHRIKLRRSAVFAGIFLFLFISSLYPCTLAVISGRATRSGRALLWKNRDTDKIDNKTLYIQGSKYAFMALVNAEDEKGDEAWGGLNSEGFAIMNSQTDDQGMPGKDGADNGRFMKRALGECANVADFEALMERSKGTLDLTANFGVIDAEGNACFFETSPMSFVKFDAGDPRVAPFGYLVRTNYGFTSPDNLKGGGYIRFERISHIIQSGYGQGRIDPKFILQEASRDLVHEKLHSYPLTRNLPEDPASPLYINTNDTINRNSSVSVILFEAAPSRDKAYLATMWVSLGQPVSSVAVPMWTQAGKVPSVTTGPATAPLNDFSKRLVSYLYPDQRGRMKQYLNVNRLRTYGGEGVLEKIFRIEDQALEKARIRLAAWENLRPLPNEIADFQEKLAAWVYESLKTAFPDI